MKHVAMAPVLAAWEKHGCGRDAGVGVGREYEGQYRSCLFITNKVKPSLLFKFHL